MFKKISLLFALAFALISCGEEATAPRKSSAKAIIQFSFPEFTPAITATIDSVSKKITATVPATADLTKLKPSITLSNKATVSPVSGSTVDFSKVVNFTVKAENGEQQIYSVEIKKAMVKLENGESFILGTSLFIGPYFTHLKH